MDLLKDWVFDQKKIITPKILSSLSSIDLDSASAILYNFYNKNKDNLSELFTVLSASTKLTTLNTETMTRDQLVLIIGDKNFQKRIQSVKVAAICEKRQTPLTINDIFNAEEYELNNKDSKFQKLRFLDIEDKAKLFPSQHMIKKSQIDKDVKPALEVTKKTYFSRSNTQNYDKESSDISRQSSREFAINTQEPKKSKRDEIEIIPEDDDGFTRKTKKTRKSTPNTKEPKKIPEIIEIE